MEVLFCKSDKLLSKLITAVTRGQFSHIALKYHDSWIVHSNLFGVTPDWYSHFRKRYRCIKALKCKSRYADMCVDILAERVGWYSYDIISLIGAGISRLLFLKKNIVHVKNAYTCVELFFEFLNIFKEFDKLDFELPQVEDDDYSILSPDEVFDLIKNSTLFEEVKINANGKTR